jgi:hypothetical protein
VWSSLSPLLGLSALAVGLCAHPQEGKQAAGKEKKVRVTVVVILASEGKDKVDPRLKLIAQEIRKENPKLKTFKLESMTCRSLVPGEKSAFDLVEGRKATVVIKHGADRHNWVGLAVTAPDQGEIEYRAVCGKFLPIVTRCQTESKDRLILAVRVQPCHGE